MLKLILVIAQWFKKEPVSLQREILDRLAKKRPNLDYSSDELLERKIFIRLSGLLVEWSRGGRCR